jgi:hypothetical protein
MTRDASSTLAPRRAGIARFDLAFADESQSFQARILLVKRPILFITNGAQAIRSRDNGIRF